MRHIRIPVTPVHTVTISTTTDMTAADWDRFFRVLDALRAAMLAVAAQDDEKPSIPITRKNRRRR